MKTIRITVEVDGNEVSRSYGYETLKEFGFWENEVESMITTIENSEIQKF